MKGRLLLGVVVAAMIVVLIWQWVTLPDRVPGQMGFGGAVTRWGTKTEYLAVMAGGTAVVAGIFGASGALLRRSPAGLLNVPHPEYWLRPQQRAELARRLGEDMAVLGAATVLLLLAGTLEIGYAAQHGGGFAYDWLALVAYLGFVAWWAVRLASSARYRPPEGWRGRIGE
ncbi:MAG: DUF1648 domain-containing protein [Austwickia sp.]|nr:DUF1648 domain-containing protein [Austwickia sp.]MBK8436739.1 DUF1648 domain-containing protein [Austwickia sp.]MBK9100369.1 DUF1648 domain-containing protein [Austwickia sp.]